MFILRKSAKYNITWRKKPCGNEDAVKRILGSNALYSEADCDTKLFIEKKVAAFAAKHRITVTDAAAVFAGRDNTRGICGMFDRKSGGAVAHREAPCCGEYLLVFRIEARELLPGKEHALYKRISDAVTLCRSGKNGRSVFYAVSLAPAPCRSFCGMDDGDTLSALYAVASDLRKRHGDRFFIIAEKRIYDPFGRRFIPRPDKAALLYYLSGGMKDDTVAETVYTPAGTGGCFFGYIMYIDRGVEPKREVFDSLLSAITCKINSPVIKNGMVASGHALVFSDVTEYIPVKHTIYSLVSDSGWFSGRSKAMLGVYNAGSLALLSHPDMSDRELTRLLRGVRDVKSPACIRRSASPVADADSCLDTVSSVFESRFVRKSALLIRAFSPVLLFILLFMAVGAHNPLFRVFSLLFLTAAIFYPLWGALSDFISAPFRSAGQTGSYLNRNAVYYALSAFCRLSLLPVSCFLSVAIFVKTLLFRNRKAAGGGFSGAEYFFILTVCGLACGFLLMTVAREMLFRLIAFIWLVSPLTVLIITAKKSGRAKHGVVARQAEGARRFFSESSDCGKEDGIRPAKAALTATALLALCDLELLSVTDAYPEISSLLALLEALPTSYGLFSPCYSAADGCYESRRSEESAADINGILFSCLICLREGLSEYLPEDDMLITRSDSLIKAASFTQICGKADLFSSPALLSHFLAVCYNGADFTDELFSAQKKGILLSPYGGADDYFLPFLFLPLFPGTLVHKTIRRVIKENIKAGAEGMWGAGACCCPIVDSNFRFVFDTENGIPSLSLYGTNRERADDTALLSPYACLLMLQHCPSKAVASLRRFARCGLFGRYGFYESVEVKRRDKSRKLVRSYCQTHVALSLIAAANSEKNGIFVRRFCSDDRISPFLYLLRGGCRINYRAPVTELKEIKAPVKKNDAGTGRLPLVYCVSNGLLSFFISDAGHIMFFTGDGALTANPFNPYDPFDISSSFSMAVRTSGGEAQNPLAGVLSRTAYGAEYLLTDRETASGLTFSLERESPLCRIRLTVKGSFDSIDFNFSLFSGKDAFVDSSGITCGNMKLYVADRQADYTIAPDGRCALSITDYSRTGEFHCEIVICNSFFDSPEASVSSSVHLPARHFPVLYENGLLAALLFAAGDKAPAGLYNKSRLYGLLPFNNPVVTCEAVAPLVNKQLYRELASLVSYLRYCGVALQLLVLCEGENTFGALSAMLPPDAIVCGKSIGDSFGDAGAFSVLYLGRDAFVSPDRFFEKLLIPQNEIPAGAVQTAANYNFSLPAGCVKIDNGYITESGAVVFRHLSTREITFCSGTEPAAYFSSHGHSRTSFHGQPVTVCEKLTVYTESGPVDLLRSSYKLEKSDAFAIYSAIINNACITTEIYTDSELSVKVYRISGLSSLENTDGGTAEVSLSIIPVSPYDDPRLTHCFTRGKDRFYRSVSEGFYSAHTIYGACACDSGDIRIFLVGIFGDSERSYYRALERYSRYSGCEAPVSEPSVLSFSESHGRASALSYLLSRRIPEFFGRLTAKASERIYGFPVLALCDPPLLRSTIAEYACAGEGMPERRLVLAAALAAYFAVSRDTCFLKERVHCRRSGFSESVYLYGMRALENFVPCCEAEALLASAVTESFRPLSAAMNDVMTEQTASWQPSRKSGGISPNPLLEAYGHIAAGNTEQGVRLLLSSAAEVFSAEPVNLSIIYAVYINFIAGYRVNDSGFTLTPRLCEAIPSCSLTIRKGTTRYFIRIYSCDGDKITLDGSDFKGSFPFDGKIHTVTAGVCINPRRFRDNDKRDSHPKL